MKRKEKDNQEQLINRQIDETFFDAGNTSTTDCTGLKYRPALSDYEDESYDEIYHFLPPSDI